MTFRGGEVATVRSPRDARSLIALAIAVVALAITAAPAFATADRADYAAQVNPICASVNAQQKQLYESFEATDSQLNRRSRKLHGKKRQRIENRRNALFDQLPDQSLALAEAELAQLGQVSPAPGDEELVSDWLTGRRTLLDLVRQLNGLELRIEHLFDNRFFHSARGFRNLDRKEKRLQAQADAIYAQVKPLNETDVELGTKLGATYCETSATGTP